MALDNRYRIFYKIGNESNKDLIRNLTDSNVKIINLLKAGQMDWSDILKHFNENYGDMTKKQLKTQLEKLEYHDVIVRVSNVRKIKKNSGKSSLGKNLRFISYEEFVNNREKY